MNVTVTFRHLPSSDALRDHAEQKVSKFLKYVKDPVTIHIVFSVEKIRQICEITVNSKNFRTHALEESQDMYTSIDKVISKIETQLRKHKERVKNHKVDNKAFEMLEDAAPMAE